MVTDPKKMTLGGRRYFSRTPFWTWNFFSTLKIYQNLLFFLNEVDRGIEPQTNYHDHEPNY